ncbi:MAG TPA: hypothetical protein VEL31_15455 [Ktedonobacteraceae bacterium]|nr:hypothetical protein [Ktedonobacteraceae bacterium]
MLLWLIVAVVCFLFLVGYFAFDIWRVLVMAWYSLAIRFFLWCALRDRRRGEGE